MFSVLNLRITAICLVLLATSACEPTLTYVRVPPVLAFDVEQSTVEVSSASIVAGASTIVVVTVRDQFGDHYYSPTTSVALSYLGGASTLAFSSVTDLGDGTYIATATGATSGSATTVHATINGYDITSTLPTVAVSTGAYTLANSLVTLSASSVTVGGTITATLTTYDVGNNLVTSGGLSVLFSNSGGTSAGTWGATTDHGNGTYTSVFTSTTHGTATTVSGSIAGSAVTSTLPTLTVNPVLVTTPTTLAATASPGSVALSWTASTGTAPITYSVKRGTASGGPYTTLSSGIAVTNYTDSTATDGTTYYYVVSATNPGGTSSDSNEVNVQSIAAFAISSVAVNGASTLDISWPSVAGATSYTLKYGTSSGVYGTTVSTSATSPTTVSALTPGTAYYFMVTAVNSVGSGTTQNATAEVAGVPESTFSISSVTQPTSQQATVAWSASTGATSYTVKYGTASGGPYGTTFSTSAISPTTVTGLTNGTTYYFQVYAVNANGSLAGTTEGSLTPIATPSVPSGLTATAGIANIALSWTASTGTSPLYTVYRSTTSGSGYTALAACTAQAGTTCTDLTASNGTTYYYVVQSSNAGGASADSSEVSGRPIASFNITSVSVNGGSSLEVTWPAVAGAASYTLKYGTLSGVYGTTVSTSATSPTTVSSLTPGTSYYFMVTAVNAEGAGNSVDASSEVSGVPMSAFTLSAGARALTTIGTSWTASTGSTSYTLKYGTATGVYGTTFSTSATSPTTVSGLTSGTNYFIRVTAVNGSGSLDSTAEISVASLSAASATWPFDAAPDPTLSYLFDGTKIDFTGGVCRLTTNDQIDDDGTSNGFTGGTGSNSVGVASYGALTGESASSGLKLGSNGSCDGSTTSCAPAVVPELYQLNSSWAPQSGSLAAIWHLDGTLGSIASGATITDATGSGANGTANTTGMTYIAGQLSQGVSFPSGTRFDVPAASAPNPCSTVTVAFWMKSTSSQGYTSPIAKGSPGWMIQKAGATTKIQVRMDTSATGGGGAATVSSASSNFFDGAWHHIAFTADNGSVKLYKDGALDATGSYAVGAGFCSSSGLRVGGDLTSSLDEIGIWTSVLTPAEISTIYNRQSVRYSGVYTSRIMDAFQTGQAWSSLAWKSTLPFMKALPDYSSGAIQNETSTDYSSLVGASGTVGDNNLMSNILMLYHLDEAAGTTAASSVVDQSGNLNHGSPTSVSFGSHGKFATAANFDGSTSYINTNKDFSFNLSQSASFSLWIHPNSITGNQGIIGKGQAGGYGIGNWEWSLYLSGSALNFIAWDTSAMPGITLSTTSIPLSAWTHIAVTYDGGAPKTAVMYKNGVAVHTQTSISSTIQDRTTPVLIGHAYMPGGNFYFSGNIDETAFWSRALNATEVKQLYQRGASRIKFQARSCATSDPTCAAATWKGPDGTANTYFSELNNMSTQAATPSGTVNKAAPSMTLQNYSTPVAANQYFQYRAIFESDSSTTALQPELKSVTVGEPHYDTASPTVVGKTGMSYYSLTTFVESLGSNGCSSGVVYNLGVGASYSSATWYYWNGSAWASDGGTPSTSTANTQAELATAGVLSSFGTQLGTGTVYFRAFLQSSGTSACELNTLQLDGFN